MKEQMGSIDPFISPTNGDMELKNGYIWIGNEDNIAAPQPYTSGGIPSGGGNNQVLQSNGNEAIWGSVTLINSGQGSLAVQGPDGVAGNAIYNTSLGIGSLCSNNANGGQNTAIGYQALANNRLCSNNTALGYQALFNIGNPIAPPSANYNTAIGGYSLYDNYTGAQNTAVGFNSLYSNHGSYNSALGADAGQFWTGSYQTFVGYNASSVASEDDVELENTTCIGANSKVGKSHSIVLGDGRCNLGINKIDPSYGIHLGQANETFTPALYLSHLPSHPLESLPDGDSLLYSKEGEVYCRNSNTYTSLSKSLPGEIRLWLGDKNTIPKGFEICNGKKIPLEDYPILSEYCPRLIKDNMITLPNIEGKTLKNSGNFASHIINYFSRSFKKIFSKTSNSKDDTLKILYLIRVSE